MATLAHVSTDWYTRIEQAEQGSMPLQKCCKASVRPWL
ncbi:hypothetical protein [Agrilactobacillus composti]